MRGEVVRTVAEFLDHLRTQAQGVQFRVERSGLVHSASSCFIIAPRNLWVRNRVMSAFTDDLACDPELRAAILDAVGIAA
jgi:hypothetical protein